MQQNGDGTAILTGNNTYSGGTTNYTGATDVNAGTLRASAENVLAPLSAFTMASGATLDLNTFGQTIGSLAGAGIVTLGSATLTAGGNNSSTTFSGVIGGTGEPDRRSRSNTDVTNDTELADDTDDTDARATDDRRRASESVVGPSRRSNWWLRLPKLGALQTYHRHRISVEIDPNRPTAILRSPSFFFCEMLTLSLLVRRGINYGPAPYGHTVMLSRPLLLLTANVWDLWRRFTSYLERVRGRSILPAGLVLLSPLIAASPLVVSQTAY